MPLNSLELHFEDVSRIRNEARLLSTHGSGRVRDRDRRDQTYDARRLYRNMIGSCVASSVVPPFGSGKVTVKAVRLLALAARFTVNPYKRQLAVFVIAT